MASNMLKRKVVITHYYDATHSVDIDATNDVSGMTITKEERCANECSFRLYDRNGQKYTSTLTKEEDVKVYINEVLEFSGKIFSMPYVHDENGNYYNITAYTLDIKLGFADTGNRVISTKYGHEILSGFTDTVFSANMTSQEKVKLVSSDAADTMTATIVGLYGIFTLNETVTLTGTSTVESANDYDTLFSVSTSSAATGNITIKDESDNTLGTIPAGFSICSESDITDCQYLDFMEGAGTTSYDKSGNGINATIANAPSWVTFGGLDFDGVNQYAYTADPFANQATWSFGCKITPEGGAGTLRAIRSPQGGNFVHFQLNASNKIEAFIYGPAVTLTSTTTVSNDTEYTVAVTFASGIGKLYVNGVLEDTSTYSATPVTAIFGDWLIGAGYVAYTNTPYVDGVINGFSTVYATAHTTATTVDTAYDYLQIGQTVIDVVGTDYYLVGRGFLSVAIPAGISIPSAVFKFTGKRNNSTTDFNMVLRESTAGQTLTLGDYAEYGAVDFGSVNSSEYTEDADGITITLNAAGLAYLNSKVGGYADFCLISQEDLDSSVPTGDEYWRLCSKEDATPANRPHLDITYTGGGRPFNGKIKQVWASDTEKTAAQLLCIHNGELPNFATGAVYTTDLRIAYSEPMDYQILYFPMYNEAPEITMERVCDIGDSNDMWTWTFDSTNELINMFPRSTTNTDYGFGDISVSFDDTESTKNGVILKCAKAKTADATLQEIVGYASTDDGLLTKIQVFQDTSISKAADATQKAESILNEISTTEKIGTATLPLKIDIDLYDRIYVYDLNDGSWGYETIFQLTHDIDAEITDLNIGHKIFSINTVETLSGFDNVARYGDIGTELPSRIFYQTSFDFNIASSYPVTVNLNIPEEGVYKVYLHVKGEKFRQASAYNHNHDNSASFTVDNQTHNYGTLEDTAQTHAFDGAASFQYNNHNHQLAANVTCSSETVSISSSGTHNHDDPYSPLARGVHTHTSDTHTHTVGGYTANRDNGRTIQYMTAGTNIGSSAADIDSGLTGSSGGTISGSSGSRTVGPTMAEDTYPDAVTLTINGVDRTAALGGPWSDNIDLTGANKLDITTYVNADGEHTLAFASTRNGRIVGHINVYY